MKKNYLTGIIGAFIGGMIASIPWILVYVYGNMILSLLAIIIAFGALKGYQLLKGYEDNKLPIIIVIISLVCVTISTLVIIPLLLLAKEGYAVSFESLKILYTSSEFFGAIIKDYIISIIFTLLGISGTIANIKKSVNINSNVEVNNNNIDNNSNVQDNNNNNEQNTTNQQN